MMLGQRSDESTKRALKEEYYLDKPLSIQFIYFINDLSPISVHKDKEKEQKKYSYAKVISVGENAVVLKWPYLGRSFQTQRPVSKIILERFPSTAWLALVSPSFVSAVIIGLIFAVVLRDYTGLNLFGSMYETHAFTGRSLELKNLILPAFTLGIRPLAIIVQLTRSSMIDALNEDYIRTARSKGLTLNKVVFKHALRNALNPVITAVSGWFAGLLAGAFFIEKVFNWKGIGMETINAVFNLDFPVVIGSTLFIGLIFIIVSIVVDIIYAWLDPRVRLQ